MIDLAIIIVNYNSSVEIIDLCQQIYNQNIECEYCIVIVDNASTQEHVKQLINIQNRENIVLIKSEINLGFGRACNIGFQHTEAKHYLLINPDVSLHTDTLNKILQISKKTPKSGIWGGVTLDNTGIPDGKSAWREPTLLNTTSWAFCLSQKLLYPKFRDNYQLKALNANSIEVDAISGCFMLISYNVLNKIKGFDPIFFLYSEELDFCKRAKHAGFQPLLCLRTTLSHIGGTSMPSNKKLIYLFRSKLLFAKKHFSRKKYIIYKSICTLGIIIRCVGFSLKKQRLDDAKQWQSLAKVILKGNLYND